VTPLFGSTDEPHQCGIVRVVGSTSAPPIVTDFAFSDASSMSCGSPTGAAPAPA
jgi:hypothetical protein